MSEEIAAKSVALTLIENLRNLGVAHIFGVPSGGWVDFMEAIRNTEGIEFILTTHEGAAGFMADVCGRLTGVPGVCFGTFGPGATNLATGVGGAYMDRSPLIALTDEMGGAMRERVVQMGIDHQVLFEPITKWTTRLDTLNAGCIIQDAAKVALDGIPGAVHIGMPVDVTAQMALQSPTPVNSEDTVHYASDETISQAWQGIARAEMPAMVIGLGAVRAGIADEIVAFAEKHTMPVFLTPMAKGMISEDHRLYGGVLFHALSDQVAETHSQADLMVAIGYDPVEFNYENWLMDIPLLNVDIVPLDIDKKQFANTFQMEGDIKTNLAFLEAGPVGETKWDIDALVARKEAMFEQMSPKSNEMGPCAVLDILRDVLPDEGIMTCDVGAHTHLIGQKWRTPKPGTQIMSNGWSSMGFGLPAAIAAKLTKPDLPVCCVVGDGGFLMTAGELATAVRYNLNIVVLVLTDNDLALIRIKQQRKNNPIYGTPVRESGGIGGDNIFGVPVLKARSESEIEEKLKEAFETDGPVIVEAFVNSREYDDLVLKKDKPEIAE